MRFYDRKEEIKQLQQQRERAFSAHSKLTVLTGRRRIGKTMLIRHALMENAKYVYLFVARSTEALLCRSFCQEIARSLEVFVPPMTTMSDVFRFIMEQGKQQRFSLIIDEFQELDVVNPAIFGQIQNYWDQYRTESHINFVVSGSAYSMMQRIFTDRKEPLFGRADSIIHLKPFSTTTLKEIIADYAPDYSNDALLALYAFTGGVPKYVELMMDAEAYTVEDIIGNVCRQDSPFIGEGRSMLVQEFGKKYNTYFSVMQAIANGFNTQAKIENILPDVSAGGYLKKLEEVYSLVEKNRPILSKPNSQTVRYIVGDHFLQFWSRYFDANQPLIEMGNFKLLSRLMLDDYPTFSGHVLEQYFRQQMRESGEYREVGAWWEPRDSQNEIDIVALCAEKGRAVAIEVKRNRKNFKPELLSGKVAVMRAKILPRYTIEQRCLTIEDM